MSTRAPRQSLLVVTEAEVTEPDYFNGLKSSCENTAVRVALRPLGRGDPRQLMKFASGILDKSPNLEIDQVWCVSDVDRVSPSQFQQAEAEARKRSDPSFHFAISNPCFELFLLLHHVRWSGPANKQVIERALKPFGQTTKRVDFSKYESGYEAAIKRSKGLQAALQSGVRWLPAGPVNTDAWKLAELVRGDISPK